MNYDELDGWWEHKIMPRFESLKDPLRRYNFLVEEDTIFRRRYCNFPEAVEIMDRFDELIRDQKYILEDLAYEASQLEKQLNIEKAEKDSVTPGSYIETPPTDSNPYPRIFISGPAFQLFDYWQKQVQPKSELTEYSFIYWAMVNDGYIFKELRPTEFISFLQNSYEVTIAPLKQYTTVSAWNRIQNYSTAKLLFRL